MPQPLKRDDLIHIDFTPNVIRNNPALASHVATVNAFWNDIEVRIAVFIAALLQGEASTVIKIFIAVQNDGARKSIIDTVTRLKMDPTALLAFQDVQAKVGKRLTERNNLIHGVWGISKDVAGKYLHHDPREAAGAFPEIMALHPTERTGRFKILQDTVMVWDDRDFAAQVERFVNTHNELFDFTRPYIGPAFLIQRKSPAPDTSLLPSAMELLAHSGSENTRKESE